MAMRTDRVGELIDGARRGRRTLVSPEGVPLTVDIAGHGERLVAFVVDFCFMAAAVAVLYYLLFLSAIAVGTAGFGMTVGSTLILFLAFLVRNLYFLHFELAWQGRTPGKRLCKLRVISRNGSELKPSALIARNLTREVEFFLPLSLFLALDAGTGLWKQLFSLGWALCLTALPFFNRDHLRAGDLIGGTQVIAIPRRVLLDDLTFAPSAPGATREEPSGGYVFTAAQLAVYGAFELQVLEEILRRPRGRKTDRLMVDVCGKICRKIGWQGDLPKDAKRFLSDFYAAERAELERGQLFGRHKEDKSDSNIEPK